MDTLCRPSVTTLDRRQQSKYSECESVMNQYVANNHVSCRTHTAADGRLGLVAHRSNGCLCGEADGTIHWPQLKQRYRAASPTRAPRLADMMTGTILRNRKCYYTRMDKLMGCDIVGSMCLYESTRSHTSSCHSIHQSALLDRCGSLALIVCDHTRPSKATHRHISALE